MKLLTERLNRELLFFDGAMGTMLQAAGLPDGTLPEVWSMSHLDVVCDIHRQYLKAGCRVVKTNTFGANALKLSAYQLSVEDAVAAAVRTARKAIEAEQTEAYIALDIGPTGKLLEPLGDLPFEKAVDVFAQMVKAGAAAGVDAVLIETMSDSYELKAAVLAAKENSDLPVICTVVFDEKGQLLTGADVQAVVAMLEGLGVDAIGMNCGLGPVSMLPLVKKLRACCSLPLVCNPNAGLPHAENGETVFDMSPEEFAENMMPIAQQAAMIGGCCGTTPAHLKAMIDRCKGIQPAKVPQYTHLTVSSYASSVVIDEHPVIIGERINPTGKKRFRQALLEDDTSYILREAVTQEENGAHILDVNVGLPDIDETERLPKVVAALQRVTALPLQIDTSDPVAMEKALRLYNGKALINSVNGKEESMATILPLVKKYGGGVVALTLDENGIPETAQGRLDIARRIVERAESLGIHRRHILVDVLTLPVSAQENAAEVTLEALRLVKQELGVKTVLGVSNVSFGLPSRETVNAAFYTMALHSGLDAGIINPNSEAMKRAFDTHAVLMGHDPHCERYIAAYSSAAPTSAQTTDKAQMTLYEAVVKGLESESFTLAESAMLAGADPMIVINEQLVPALDTVGVGFENGTLFLPQLLMSAQAAKEAFEAIKRHMNTETQTNAGTVVIATVKGDIHDIGKNIVKVLLENYQFRVIDLGKDVPPETVVQAVKEHHVMLVGLSALMTTTVPAMAKTIEMLRDACPWCKVMVGGAVLTQEYADQIGADAYAKDAMASVQYAKSVFA